MGWEQLKGSLASTQAQPWTSARGPWSITGWLAVGEVWSPGQSGYLNHLGSRLSASSTTSSPSPSIPTQDAISSCGDLLPREEALPSCQRLVGCVVALTCSEVGEGAEDLGNRKISSVEKYLLF